MAFHYPQEDFPKFSKLILKIMQVINKKVFLGLFEMSAFTIVFLLIALTGCSVPE